MAVMLVFHGRLVYPIYGTRVDTPEAAALVVMVFYGGLHAIYLLLAVATIVLSLAMRRGADAKGIAYLGFATAALDIIGSYPWAIGPVLTLVCECGNPTCVQQITLRRAEYEEVRAEPTHFAVYPGHEIPEVEEVVEKRDGYDIIRKREGQPAEVAEETDPRG